MSKKQTKGQAGNGNRAMYDAMMEKRRSNAAVPVRNRKKYRRADARNAMQRSAW